MATLADRLIDEMDELASAALRRLEGPIEAERNYVRKQQQQQLRGRFPDENVLGDLFGSTKGRSVHLTSFCSEGGTS